MAKNTSLLKPSAVFEFSFIFGVQAESNTSYFKKEDDIFILIFILCHVALWSGGWT